MIIPPFGRIRVGIIAALAVIGAAGLVVALAHPVSAADTSAANSAALSTTESVLYSFCPQRESGTPDCPDGENPNGIIQGSDGNLYGTTPSGGANPALGGFGGGSVFEVTPSGAFTTIYSFCSEEAPNTLNCLDGQGPNSLIQGSDGNFYGTTATGGLNYSPGGSSAGTVFEVTSAGTLTSLYSFCAQIDPTTENCLDGTNPNDVIEGTDGSFYGTTSEGGEYAFGGTRPAGTVFKLTPTGTLTTLYSFCGQMNGSLTNCLDGEEPSGIIEGSDGNFYGTTLTGGQHASDGGGGTVFEITPAGTFATLYSFCSQVDPNTGDCLDGNAPDYLIQGSDGNFYGTTVTGGASDGGTIFKMTPAGTLTTLYSFCSQRNTASGNCPDGEFPTPGLIEGRDGNFYGTTRHGGSFGGGGTAFMITPSGALTTLYSFCSLANCTDGSAPDDGVIEGQDGDFYGTTIYGGTDGVAANNYFSFSGTVFELTVSSPGSVPATLKISPGRHSFGKIPYARTREASFLVRAHSHGKNAAPIVLEGIAITGEYSIDPNFTTCKQGQTLTRNQTCKIVVDFTPSEVTKGQTDTGTLTVVSNARKVRPKGGVIKLRGGEKAPHKPRR